MTAQVVIANGFLFTTCTPDKPYDPGLSARAQMEQALARLDKRLLDNGSDRTRLVQVTVVLADIRHFDEVNLAWNAWVDPDHLPARVGHAAALGRPDIKVELVVTALA
jgi:enamine deaminase RidA (YjgF/YER057c/UK114 family)